MQSNRTRTPPRSIGFTAMLEGNAGAAVGELAQDLSPASSTVLQGMRSVAPFSSCDGNTGWKYAGHERWYDSAVRKYDELLEAGQDFAALVAADDSSMEMVEQSRQAEKTDIQSLRGLWHSYSKRCEI